MAGDKFSCLNNYSQFENSIDFNKEIVHNVTSSNKLTTSNDAINISCTKECSKEPIRDQITPSKHSTVPSINSNQALSKEPIRDRKIKTDRPNAPTTTIIGDSMIKKVFGDKLSRQLDNKHYVVVRSFGGAKTQCMEGYIKPTVKLAPKQIILHCGTNNLPSNEDPETIAKNIMNLAKNIKTDITKVAVSGIIPRRDTFNHQAKQVNQTLKKMCEEENIPFISHHGINNRFRLNSRGLHLNDKGATRLAQNFKKFLSNVHERALRIVHDDHISSYSELLKTNNERTIHQQNINVLMKEIYKFENDLSPPLIDDMFQVRKINYDLRHFQKIANTKKTSVKMGLDIISYRAPQLWKLVPRDIKDALSLSTFKKKIKSWYCDSFPM